MTERIARDDVEYVARLARLELTPEEIDLFTGQLGDIPPTAHPLPIVNVYRADEVVPSVDRDEVLAQAPAAESGQFRVPPVLGEEP